MLVVSGVCIPVLPDLGEVPEPRKGLPPPNTHKWPPISGWFTLYLNKAWREANAPHADLAKTNGAFGYSCDFDCPTTAFAWDGWLSTKHDEVKTFAMQRYVNSMNDIIFHLTKQLRK